MSRLAEQTRALTPPASSVVPRVLVPLASAAAVGLVASLVVGPAIGGYASTVMLSSGIAIILAVSLTVVNGFTGQFSMGHAGFMAVGGYVAAAITYYGSIKLFGSADYAGGSLSFTGVRGSPKMPGAPIRIADVLFIGSCLLGGLASAGAGYVVGLPSLRLRGDYLAIVTLGFGEIVRVIFQGSADQIPPWKADEARGLPIHELATKLGGPKGFNLLPTYTTLFWVFLLATLTLVICHRLKSSSSGRAFLSIREDEVAAQAMGVDITRYKVRAFVLSAFFAGVAGGLYAMQVGAINAGDLGFQKSFDIIIMVVLGGLGSISGAALAAIVLTILPELLRSPPPVWPLALVVLAAMAIAQRRAGRWKLGRLGAAAAIFAGVEIGRVVAIRNGVDLAGFRLILYALLLITMMLSRPQGLMGVREVWEIRPRRGGRPGAASA